jgi:hypothetical protein
MRRRRWRCPPGPATQPILLWQSGQGLTVSLRPAATTHRAGWLDHQHGWWVAARLSEAVPVEVVPTRGCRAEAPFALAAGGINRKSVCQTWHKHSILKVSKAFISHTSIVFFSFFTFFSGLGVKPFMWALQHSTYTKYKIHANNLNVCN